MQTQSQSDAADQAKPLLDSIQSGFDRLAELTDQAKISTAMQSWLAFIGSFHNYSLYNQILIAIARPDATLVAGYKAWARQGRQVLKGEHGIPILCPRFRRILVEDQDTGQVFTHRQLTGFNVGHVFDVSQTEGDPLPEPPRFIDDGEEGQALCQALLQVAGLNDIVIEERVIDSGAFGISSGGRITLASDLPPKMWAHVMAHELAHEFMRPLLEQAPYDRVDSEIKAEAIAYVVCQHFGLEVAAPNYLAIWTADSTRLRERFDAISRVAGNLIGQVERVMAGESWEAEEA